ncbi:MAG: SRPBCC family protein [Pseudomonadota bacterium]
MQFHERIEMQASPDYLFARLTDTAAIAERMGGHGIQLRRSDRGTDLAGAVFDCDLRIRGREMRATVCVTEVVADRRVAFRGEMQGFRTEGAIEIEALGADRCAAVVGVALTPHGLRARLFAPTLRMMQGRITARAKKLLRRFRARIETGYRAATG